MTTSELGPCDFCTRKQVQVVEFYRSARKDEAQNTIVWVCESCLAKAKQLIEGAK